VARSTATCPPDRPRQDGRIRTHVLIATAIGLVLAAAGAGGYYWATACGPSVIVESDPPGATVTLDGVYRGLTPCRIHDVSAAEHVLKLTKYGYTPHARTVRLKRAQRERIRIDLTREEKHALTVASEPTGATVALDGEPMGGRTPLEIPSLKAGCYEILVRKEGRLPVRRQVHVGPGQPATLEVKLPSRTETYYLESIRSNPETISNYTELAHHYVIAHEFSDAGAAFTKAIDLAGAPGADKKHVSRLRQEVLKIYYKQFEYGDEEAVAQAKEMIEGVLTQAVEDNPTSPFPYQMLAAIFLTTQRHGRAEKVLTRGLKRVPDNPSLLLMLAKVLHRRRQLEPAATCLEQLLRVDARNLGARNLLAEIYQRQGKLELAVKHRRFVASMGSSNPDAAIGALSCLAGLHHRNGDFAEAAAAWEKAAGLQKDPALRAHYRMAAASEHAKAGRVDRATGIWKEILRTCTDDALVARAQQELHLCKIQKP